MPLEDLVGPNKYLDSLVREWPLGIDPFAEGDDHIRGLKNTVLNSFPTVAGPIYPATHVLPPNGESESTAGATQLAAGTTAQRVAAPVSGQIRYNSDLTYLEQYVNGSGWVPVDTVGSLALGDAGQVLMSDGSAVVYGSAGLNITGLTIEKGTTPATHRVLKAGSCNNFAGIKGAVLPSDLQKIVTQAWVEGDNVGGYLPVGSVGANESLHYILMTKDADGTVDWGFDTDPAGANVPAGWTAHRRLGSIKTDGASALRPMTQYPNGRFMFDVIEKQDLPQGMANSGAGNTTPSLETWDVVPLGVELCLHGTLMIKMTSSGGSSLWIGSHNVSTMVTSVGGWKTYVAAFSSEPGQKWTGGEFNEAWCNTAAQNAMIRAANSTEPSGTVHGWCDPRGQV